MYNSGLHTSSEQVYAQIADKPCYSLKVDKAKNRIYFSINGYWKNKENVPDLLDDWKKAVACITPGFTVLTDMRTMITHPQELHELHLAAQKLVIQAGVKQVANVLPTDRIANLQATTINTNSLLPYRDFESCEEAEVWLNQFEQLKQN